eukprot:1028446-Heterocapsa_arctica.AAC.1
MWWEALLIPKGSIPLCPEHFQVPSEWIAKLQPAREFCADIIRDCTTLAEVIKKVVKAAATLISLDRNFECDIIYLQFHAQKILQEQIEQAILDTLPFDGASADFARTLENIRDVRKSDAALALGESFVNEIDGIYDTLQQILSGQPPQDNDIPRFSKLMKAVLQRAALFCHYKFTPAEAKSRGKDAPLNLYGCEAVQFRFKMLEDKKSSDEHFDVQELRPVKQFKWLLEDAQKITFH